MTSKRTGDNIFSMSDFRKRRLGGTGERERSGMGAEVPFIGGFECSESGVQFPRIFRVSYPDLTQTPDGRIVPTGGFFVHYQLSVEQMYLNGTHPDSAPAAFEPIGALTPRDRCWLEVYHFLDAQEAFGFAYAAKRLQKRDDRCLIFSGEHGLFVLLVREDEPLLYGLITYHAQEMIHQRDFDQLVCHTTTVGMDGSSSLGDPLDLLAEGFVPVSNLDNFDD
ncbi:hypothetical protein [Geopseudomonas aromaticivorans]